MERHRQSLATLAKALSLENDRKKRSALLQRLKKKLMQLSAIEDRAISPKEAYDAEYWRSRAQRTLNLAAKHHNKSVSLHFAKIADGYLKLARQAEELQRAHEIDR